MVSVSGRPPLTGGALKSHSAVAMLPLGSATLVEKSGTSLAAARKRPVGVTLKRRQKFPRKSRSRRCECPVVCNSYLMCAVRILYGNICYQPQKEAGEEVARCVM